MKRTTGIAAAVAIGAGAALYYDTQRARRELARQWQDLRRRTDPAEPFDPASVSSLPEPVSRYLRHSIAGGAPLARGVELSMGGEIRLKPEGDWLPMKAEEIIAPEAGFIWRVRVRMGLLAVSGADAYLHGEGSQRFRLWTCIPFLRASGPDVSRSALGRLAGESVFCPSGLLPERGVQWRQTGPLAAEALLNRHGEAVTLRLTFHPTGPLHTVQLRRWGDPDQTGTFGMRPFGMEVLEEGTFGGYTIPVRIRGGWHFGSEGHFDFFHPVVTAARFF